MTCQLDAFCIDATDPGQLAGFWSEFLGWQREGDDLVPPTGFRLRFLAADEPKSGRNLHHVDLTSQSPEDQQEQVARALALGAAPMDVGQTGDEGHIVLGDPGGNEFCVIEAGNNFLAGCGRIGALAGDGTRAVGHFWAEALDWPLRWDQDEETAIQSPAGGTKISWGGPPLNPKNGRVHFDLAPPAGADQRAEIDRLLALGATLRHTTPDGRAELSDPDGNKFCVLTPR